MPIATTAEGNSGRLDLDRLRAGARAGEIETVLVGFVDMQGRLQGKECGAGHFLKVVAEHGSHACNYLLSVDVEMEPQDGFETSGWSSGHGDFELVPDLGSLRHAAWRPRTAICLADARTLRGAEINPAPRTVLKRQLDRLQERGWSAKAATELEFIVHRESYREAWARDYASLSPMTYYNSDYSLLGMRHAGALLDRIKRDTAASGFDLETAKGEANRGQCEVNFRYGDPIEAADSHAIFKHLVKEIALEEEVSVTFMAKWDEREGNSCHIHLSLQDEDGSLFDRETDLFERFIAGQLACMEELTLLFAPNPNSYKRFASRSFAPTAIAWGNDNRSCAVRVVGAGSSLRMEHRLPGADVNLLRTMSDAEVIAIDPNVAARQLAVEAGAHWAFGIESRDLDRIRELTDGHGVDAVVDFVGEKGATAIGVDLLRRAGSYYVIGYGEDLCVPTIDIISREINFIGNLVGTYRDLVELMELVNRDEVQVETVRYRLDAVGDALADLNAGRVCGRGVLTPASTD